MFIMPVASLATEEEALVTNMGTIAFGGLWTEHCAPEWLPRARAQSSGEGNVYSPRPSLPRKGVRSTK